MNLGLIFAVYFAHQRLCVFLFIVVFNSHMRYRVLLNSNGSLINMDFLNSQIWSILSFIFFNSNQFRFQINWVSGRRWVDQDFTMSTPIVIKGRRKKEENCKLWSVFFFQILSLSVFIFFPFIMCLLNIFWSLCFIN